LRRGDFDHRAGVLILKLSHGVVLSHLFEDIQLEVCRHHGQRIGPVLSQRVLVVSHVLIHEADDEMLFLQGGWCFPAWISSSCAGAATPCVSGEITVACPSAPMRITVGGFTRVMITSLASPATASAKQQATTAILLA
jgi:hypothetical protein